MFEHQKTYKKLIRPCRADFFCAGNLKSIKQQSDFDAFDDIYKSTQEGFRAIRERMRNGGPGWKGHE